MEICEKRGKGNDCKGRPGLLQLFNKLVISIKAAAKRKQDPIFRRFQNLIVEFLDFLNTVERPHQKLYNFFMLRVAEIII